MPALKVFYSYPRKDEALRHRLANHLAAYEKEGLIKGWHDAEMPGGARWKTEIEQRIGAADIVLLLITENYFASDWCMAEYDLAMTRHDAGKCRVVPINLRAVEWPESLKVLNAIPPLSQPIVNGVPAQEDRAFQNTAVALRRVAESVLEAGAPQPAPPPPPIPPPIPPALRIVQPPRPITRDIAFLCNWTDQEDQLRAGFLNAPANKLRTPFLTLICGHPDDCHEEFIARIRNSPLPGQLGVKTVNPLRVFNWPDPEVRSGLTTDQLFTSRVGKALELENNDKARMVRRLPRGLTIVRSTIDCWSDTHIPLIEAYAAFWDSWPVLGAGKALAPCLCVKDIVDAQVEPLRQRLAFASFERLRGAVVGLLPIRQSHAENWLELPEIKPLYADTCKYHLDTDIQRIFTAGQARMQQVADGLTRALLNHCGEHQHAG